MNSKAFLSAIAGLHSVDAVLKAVRQERLSLMVEVPECSLTAVLLALFRSATAGTLLAVVPQDIDAAELANNLAAFGVPAIKLPWWGTLVYREIPPLSAVFGERVQALTALADGSSKVIIVPERAFLTPVPPADYLRSLLITVKPGMKLDTSALAKTLTGYGYTRVPRVQLRGEFAMRGEVLDVCMGADEAYRVLLDFDRVQSIRSFDIIDQSTTVPCTTVRLRPLKETIWTDERILMLQEKLEALPEFATHGERIIEALIANGSCPNEELFFALAFDRPAPVIDYLKTGDTVCFFNRERLENAQESIAREYEAQYRKSSIDRELPAPEHILLDFLSCARKVQRTISFMSLHEEEREKRAEDSEEKKEKEEKEEKYVIKASSPRSFFGNITFLKEEIGSLLSQGWEVAVATESEVQAERIRTLIKNDDVSVMLLPISSGFAIPELPLLLIQENEIFGRRTQRPSSVRTARSAVIDTFVELNQGDFVVHLNYGIGRFKGIDRIKALGHERDYIKLEYADEETVFVPIEQVNLVQRYIGNEGNDPQLDRLGSKSWEGRKSRVKKAVEDLAGRLLELYSKRKASSGFACSADTEWQAVFEASFPFEETDDQIRCVEEIKADMESPHPMDRLICGDVGYGKTEVAVRACFKAIMSGMQVAFLAPTTILVEQHFENFQERFAQFPVRIAMLSRLVDRATIKKTLEAVRSGAVDLLVGTHRIIQKDVQFKRLGLMVVDEEQRFGVKDKERLKELKHNVDCLTLTATPIPRTLHISLLKIRDMSLLTTPPQNRHPIETVIGEYREEQIAAAIRREVDRSGQIFYLHNRIESLDETRRAVEQLVPEMLVDTAHGQMDPRALEDVMHRFIHGGFHVLVSTTIIENGIDIPNVNTIIIDRADLYGVSQLYQLRGRVGRSDRVAYAYLFYPDRKSITDLAMKRLQVISDFTDLGSGFKIALKDMEIRGAGNLLGREQSGDIYSVGFDLYMRLLDEAIKRLENEQYEAETETLLELEYSGFIPDIYIDSMQEKIDVYKKIASVREKTELRQVYAELVDRFGPVPEEVSSLLSLAEIRVICRELSISSMKEQRGIVRVTFAKMAKIKVDRLLSLIKQSKGTIKLDPKAPNVITVATGSVGLKEKSTFIREKLSALT
jgi:transcription-repair coupling factor (superfamily II helicase)